MRQVQSLERGWRSTSTLSAHDADGHALGTIMLIRFRTHTNYVGTCSAPIHALSEPNLTAHEEAHASQGDC